MNGTQVRLLGPIDVLADGIPVPVHGRCQKTLLAVLSLRAREVISADHLADVLWGAHPPATAANTLQRHISSLRRVLGDKRVIAARAPGYVLQIGGDGVEATDAEAAERLIRHGLEAPEPIETVAALRDALAL
jgi:DNA-binding SARP family transcriptional activator